MVYDDEGGGWAGRFIWLLDCIGHRHYSYLNGGWVAWYEEERPLTTDMPEITPSHYPLDLTQSADHTATLDEILEGLDAASRSSGTPARRRNLPGSGLPQPRPAISPARATWNGPRPWRRSMACGCATRTSYGRLLERMGITPDKTVITHCQTHHRSGFTYLVAKVIGLSACQRLRGLLGRMGQPSGHSRGDLNRMRDKLFVLSQYLTPQHTLSRAAGRFAESATAWVRQPFIHWFASRYGVDMKEAADRAIWTPMPDFNSFFTRALKPDAPALSTATRKHWSVRSTAKSVSWAILATIALSRPRDSGSVWWSCSVATDGARRLSGTASLPPSIWRPGTITAFTCPWTAPCAKWCMCPGKLFSVNPTTAENVPRLFARNERVVALFDTALGAHGHGPGRRNDRRQRGNGMVRPGGTQPRAACTLPTTTMPTLSIWSSGAEMGRFRLGSTVVVALPKGAAKWLDQISARVTGAYGGGFDGHAPSRTLIRPARSGKQPPPPGVALPASSSAGDPDPGRRRRNPAAPHQMHPGTPHPAPSPAAPGLAAAHYRR